MARPKLVTPPVWLYMSAAPAAAGRTAATRFAKPAEAPSGLVNSRFAWGRSASNGAALPPEILRGPRHVAAAPLLQPDLLLLLAPRGVLELGLAGAHRRRRAQLEPVRHVRHLVGHCFVARDVDGGLGFPELVHVVQLHGVAEVRAVARGVRPRPRLIPHYGPRVLPHYGLLHVNFGGRVAEQLVARALVSEPHKLQGSKRHRYASPHTATMQSGESIYNLIPHPVMMPPMQHMHVSKHPGEVDPHGFEIGVNNKRGKATFGHATGTLKPKTDHFLKSHAGEPTLPPPAPPTLPKDKMKPAVPLKGDKPVMGLVSAKNFVTANAVENILSQPKKKFVEPTMSTSKPDYGKVPRYLQTIKGQIQSEKEMIAEYQRQQAETMGGSMRQMSTGERDALVVELKQKWQKVNEAYQKLPFTLDTPMRKIRKESLESELTQLEKDIKTMQGRQVVVVEEDYSGDDHHDKEQQRQQLRALAFMALVCFIALVWVCCVSVLCLCLELQLEGG
eukprot:CAMPEP_0197587294 /NCGR_PEP_ID=MMETSP1326-20131121/8965_1 /TAXON_ID=1155430 /ORGANISM="Genus nov. species nov., Strain RCC2288" /LENGTH=503 /DNA_ID=CAMNT_0043152001 /DNA_START=175 /DNA_END=1683 /DNA_ORIENTATION=-